MSGTRAARFIFVRDPLRDSATRVSRVINKIHEGKNGDAGKAENEEHEKKARASLSRPRLVDSV